MARLTAGIVLPGGFIIPPKGNVLWGADDGWGWTTVGVPSGGPPWTTHPGIERPQMLNRKMAIRNNHTDFGSTIGLPPSDAAVMPMVTWGSQGNKFPVLPSSQNPLLVSPSGDKSGYVKGGHTYYGYDRILQGQFDATITAALTAASSASSNTVLFRPWQEQNIAAMNAYGAYQGSTLAAGQAKFIAAWQYVHGFLSTLGITNLAFLWCASEDAGSADYALNATGYYPGDAYVDVIALDLYRHDFVGSVDVFYDFALTRGKPFMISEAGFESTQAAMVTETQHAIEGKIAGTSTSGNYDECFAYVYWNHQGVKAAWTNLIDDGAGMLAAFQSFTGDPVFTATATYSSGGDSTPPTGPTALSATGISNTQVLLAWSGAADNVGVDHYQVWRAGAKIADPVTATSYTDSGLAKNTSYVYQVKAVDAAGNVSTTGATATGKTLDQSGGGTSSAGLVQTAGNHSTTTVTSLSVTPGAHTTAGNMLVLVFQGNTKATNVSGVADSALNGGWVNLGVTQSGEASSHLEVWGCPNAASVSSVTVSVGTAEKMAAMLLEVTGIVTTSPVDVAVGSDDSNVSGVHTTGNAVTTHAADFLIAACAFGASGGAPFTPGTPPAWQETPDVAGSGASLAVATLDVTKTGTYNCTFAANGSAQAVAGLGIVALKAASSGGGGGGGGGGAIAAQINYARWIILCTVCGNGVPAPLGTANITCPECGTAWSPTYPSNHDQIAQLLAYRPSQDLISWTANQSASDLAAQNRANGWLPAPSTVTASETIR